LWGRLCRARLPHGQARLEALLKSGPAASSLAERQAAAERLAGLSVWRHHFEGRARQVALDEDRLAALLAWSRRPTLPHLRPLLWTGAALVALTWGSILLAALFDYATPWRATLIIQILLFALTTRRFGEDYAVLLSGEGAGPLLALRELLALVERRRFHDPLLEAQRAALGHPTADLRALEGAINGLAARASALTWGAINVLGLWELFQYGRLSRWRETAGARLPDLLAGLADIEALVSIAGYRADHPLSRWPEILSDADPGPLFEARALAHPLFAPSGRRGNDVTLAAGQLQIITGSNMSGKSSLLRTIGLNARMALAGLPVCAEALRLRPCALSTSIQVTDAPGEGLSRFYAEVKRIKRILDEVASAEIEGALPRIFLIDEMLSGTNSRERHIASEAITRRLLEARRSTGLITTHDLDLVKLAEAAPARITLGHFSDHFDGEALHFDYTLKPGVARTTNALLVLRLEGIEAGAASTA
ncbi:hypothetical protein KKB55_05230, partial [Myxococcota bacterium]|nr:hypothetical protein [Myxococcota bacterium]